MNNIFNRTNLKNFIYKKTPNIRDILKTSLNIYPKNKDINKDTHNKNKYISKLISNNVKFKKKNIYKKPNQLKQPKQIFTTKEPIPKRIRELVWTTNNGETFTNKCYVTWCTNNINVFNFQVGHDIPESKGGTIDIDNLKPICSNCNLSMSNKYTITEWSKLIKIDECQIDNKTIIPTGKKNDNNNNYKTTFITKIKNILPKIPSISLVNLVLNSFRYLKL